MENFQLKKVKLSDDLGVEATYHEKVMNEGSAYWVENTKKNMIPRHNDMDIAAEKFKIHVARIYGMLALGLYKEEKEMSKREKQLLEATLNDMTILSISISGSEESLGVVISAKKTVFGNKIIVMNTPLMKFADEKYDFCYDLGEAVQKFTKEVWDYLFKRKYAQLELAFGGDDEPSEEVTKISENIESQIAEHQDSKANDGKVVSKKTTGSKKNKNKIITKKKIIKK